MLPDPVHDEISEPRILADLLGECEECDELREAFAGAGDGNLGDGVGVDPLDEHRQGGIADVQVKGGGLIRRVERSLPESRPGG